MQSLSNPHLMVVEDDADIRDALSDLLANEGYRVTDASDGLRALERLDRGELPDLILLDMMMPRLDGRGFLQKVRSTPHWAHLKVLVVSATEVEAPPGVAGVVKKPFEPAQLLQEIARAL
jgi:CheY-like chemotaxis protein